MAVKHNLKIFGDLQCSSQMGSVAKFKNFDLLCPTEREARVALGANDEGVEWLAKNLIRKTASKNLILKLGSEGFIAYGEEKGGFINRQHFPIIIVIRMCQPVLIMWDILPSNFWDILQWEGLEKLLPVV